MTPPFDVPAPLAGPLIAVITCAVAYLMCIDWIHPDNQTPEQ